MALTMFASFRGYVLASLLLTTAVISHAVYMKRFFFRSVVFLARSKFAILAVGNMALVSVLLLWRLVQAVFLGPLRFREVERLHIRARDAIIECCFAISVFREEFDVKFVALVLTLLLLKSLHWLTKERIEFLEEQPLSPVRTHVRLVGLMTMLLALDLFLVRRFATVTYRSRGPTMFVLFAFEFTVLVIELFSDVVRYAFLVIDTSMEGHWEEKGMFSFYIELLGDLCQLTVYILFFIYVQVFYSFPYHIIRELYMTFHKFQRRCTDFMRYRRVVATMNDLFEDATEEELAEGDRTCIICREEMQTAKKLACGHIFHARCLQSWLKRQLTCPTCRATIDVSGSASQSNTSRNPNLNNAPRQQMEANNNNDNNNNANFNNNQGNNNNANGNNAPPRPNQGPVTLGEAGARLVNFANQWWNQVMNEAGAGPNAGARPNAGAPAGGPHGPGAPGLGIGAGGVGAGGAGAAGGVGAVGGAGAAYRAGTAGGAGADPAAEANGGVGGMARAGAAGGAGAAAGAQATADVGTEAGVGPASGAGSANGAGGAGSNAVDGVANEAGAGTSAGTVRNAIPSAHAHGTSQAHATNTGDVAEVHARDGIAGALPANAEDGSQRFRPLQVNAPQVPNYGMVANMYMLGPDANALAHMQLRARRRGAWPQPFQPYQMPRNVPNNGGQALPWQNHTYPFNPFLPQQGLNPPPGAADTEAPANSTDSSHGRNVAPSPSVTEDLAAGDNGRGGRNEEQASSRATHGSSSTVSDQAAATYPSNDGASGSRGQGCSSQCDGASSTQSACRQGVSTSDDNATQRTERGRSGSVRQASADAPLPSTATRNREVRVDAIPIERLLAIQEQIEVLRNEVMELLLQATAAPPIDSAGPGVSVASDRGQVDSTEAEESRSTETEEADPGEAAGARAPDEEDDSEAAVLRRRRMEFLSRSPRR